MNNLNTKQSRLDSRNYQFSALIEKGYLQETYKEIDFFTLDSDKYFTLKVFKGTGANHVEYINYRTAERRAEIIANYKRNYESRQDYKAELKIKNKGKLSSHAAAAAAIKEELKSLYPHIKFSVKSESFSMGNSVHVNWTDGPTSEEVDDVIKKYQYGSFNGMEDMYENTNDREDIPQAKYVSGSRSISDEVEAILLPDAEKLFVADRYNHIRDAVNFLRQIFYNCSIPAGATVTGIVSTGVDGGVSRPETFYKIGYTLPETAQQPEQPNYTAIEVTKGEINIVDYSEKAFAVIGDTKPIKEQLKVLGGSFNPRLTCGAGWIFSKKKLDEVTKALSEETTATEPEQPEILALSAPEVTEPETIILETPQTNVFKLDYFRIIWHEGHQTPNYENTTFSTWEEVQTAFVNLWERNEKGQDGGYTKVKCEIKFIDQEIIITRIDITNRLNNGDFNPTQIHIVTYLQSIADESDPEQPTQQYYETLPEIKEAAQTGKLISLYNLSQLVK